MDTKHVAEFRKEALLMSRLRHPNFTLFMGASLDNGRPLCSVFFFFFFFFFSRGPCPAKPHSLCRATCQPCPVSSLTLRRGGSLLGDGVPLARVAVPRAG